MTPLGFDIASRLMVALAIAIVVVPLVIRRRERRVWLSATVAALFVYLGSAVAYPYLSNWHWNARDGATGGGAAPADMTVDIDALRAAATRAPDDPQAWTAYALSLLHAGRNAQALEPLQRVYMLTDGANPDLSMVLVDLLMAGGESRRDDVNRLVEDILRRTPDHPKALFYGAELAFSRGERELARTRWERLLVRARQEQGEEAQRVIAVLERRIAALDAPASGESPLPARQAPEPSAQEAKVTVDVSVAPALAGRFDADSPLFVLARASGEGGPPVAVVRRRAGELPLSVTLSDAQAMLATRKLSQFESVEIVARIATGGGPVAAPGDLFGIATARPRTDGAVSIQIDRVQQ